MTGQPCPYCGEPEPGSGHDRKLESQIVKAMGCADDTAGRLALKALVERHTGTRIDCKGVYE